MRYGRPWHSPCASFIGHSNGGRTILAMSREYADCFEKLVLCGSAGVKP